MLAQNVMRLCEVILKKSVKITAVIVNKCLGYIKFHVSASGTVRHVAVFPYPLVKIYILPQFDPPPLPSLIQLGLMDTVPTFNNMRTRNYLSKL